MKPNPTHQDLYTLVDGILQMKYTDEKYLAFVLWFILKTGNYEIFSIADEAFGNSVTGIAHHTEELLCRGSKLDKFTKFINLYEINTEHFPVWLNYLIEVGSQFPYRQFSLGQYGD